MIKESVSVIIPTYNRAEYLKSAVGCVLRQTVVPDEIIIIDDGSIDNTREVIESLQKENQQLVYIWQANKGVAAARNRGLLAVRYPVVAFLDSDDTWHPRHIERALACFATFPEAGVLFAKYELEDLKNKIDPLEVIKKYQRRDMAKKISSKSNGKFYLLDTERCLRNTLLGSVGFSSSTLVINWTRCCRIFYFDENLTIGEDVDFRLQLLSSGIVFAYIDEVHSKYFIHDTNQISTSHDNQQQKFDKLLSVVRHEEKKIMYCNSLEEYKFLYKNLSGVYAIIASNYCDFGEYEEAYKWYFLSCRMKIKFCSICHVILYNLIGLFGYHVILKSLKSIKEMLKSLYMIFYSQLKKM